MLLTDPCAAQIIFYSPVLFSSLGSSQTTALLSTVIVGAVNVLSTLVAVFGVDKFGRRILLLEAGVQVSLGPSSLMRDDAANRHTPASLSSRAVSGLSQRGTPATDYGPEH